MTNQNKTILISFLSFVVFGAYEGVLGVAWPSMSQTFAVPLGSLGILLVIGLVGFVLVSFSSGWLIRKASLFWLLIISLFLRASGFAVMALSPVWMGAVLSIFLISMGAGGIDTSLNGFVSRHHSARQLNWLHACVGVGATLGPFLVAAVFKLGAPWQWSFGILAMLQALTVLLVASTFHAWQEKPGQEMGQAIPAPEAGLAKTLRLRVVWLSLLLFFLYTGAELTAGQWSFSLFTLGRGVPALAASTWVGIYWGSFTMGRILFGVIVEKVQVNKFMRMMLGAVIIGAAFLWWNPVDWVGFIGLALIGFALAPVFPTLIAGTMSRVGAAHAANTIGFQIAAAGLGVAGLTGLAGVLADAYGLETIAAFIFVLTVLIYATHELLLAESSKRPADQPGYVNSPANSPLT